MPRVSWIERPVTGALKAESTKGHLMRFVLVAGTTRTARIEGLTAAGATPAAAMHTPGADAEIVVHGEPVESPVVPVSPTGCPTPAVVTRAVRDLVEFPVTVIDGGLLESPGVRTVDVGAEPGGDVRDAEPVPAAAEIHARGRRFGRDLHPDEPVYIAETIPGGTTTALGVLQALGEPPVVSSSLAENPLDRKRDVVATGLAASDLDPGGASTEPVRALRHMGDPVLAAASGIVRGALDTDTTVVLAGGTQLLAVAALCRHAGIEQPFELATTPFVLADDSASVRSLAATLDVRITSADPGFDRLDHPAAAAYCRGESKEGVGMGGALRIAEESSASMGAIRERFVARADQLRAPH